MVVVVRADMSRAVVVVMVVLGENGLDHRQNGVRAVTDTVVVIVFWVDFIVVMLRSWTRLENQQFDV